MVQGGRWGAALAQGRRRVEPADEQLRVWREAEALRAAPDDAGHEGAVAHAVLDGVLIRPVGALLHVVQVRVARAEARVEDRHPHARPRVPQPPQRLGVELGCDLRHRLARHARVPGKEQLPRRGAEARIAARARVALVRPHRVPGGGGEAVNGPPSAQPSTRRGCSVRAARSITRSRRRMRRRLLAELSWLGVAVPVGLIVQALQVLAQLGLSGAIPSLWRQQTHRAVPTERSQRAAALSATQALQSHHRKVTRQPVGRASTRQHPPPACRRTMLTAQRIVHYAMRTVSAHVGGEADDEVLLEHGCGRGSGGRRARQAKSRKTHANTPGRRSLTPSRELRQDGVSERGCCTLAVVLLLRAIYNNNSGG